MIREMREKRVQMILSLRARTIARPACQTLTAQLYTLHLGVSVPTETADDGQSSMARGYASTRFMSSVSPSVPFAGFLHHAVHMYTVVVVVF